MVIPWIMIAILVLLIVFGIIFAVLVKKNKGKHETDYYSFFVMGIIWLPFGLVIRLFDSDSYIGNMFIVLGLAYTIIGLVNRKKWVKKKITPEKKRLMWISVIIGLIVFGLGVLVYFLS
jgi:flagellar basal body-associated protein FliL